MPTWFSIINRFDIKGELSESCIDGLAKNRDLSVVQTRVPLRSESWRMLNEMLIKRRPDVEIRVYDHGLKSCDLSLLEHIPDVERLSLDRLQSVSNFEFISMLRKLKSVSVGISDLKSFEFLESLPDSIEKVFLGATKSKTPSLQGLSKLTKIRELHIEGQTKDIDTIGNLLELEKLLLRSVSPADIGFIRKLSKLWSLDIKLGGIKNLNPLEGLANLKYLELWQVKGLSDISVVSSLVGLQYLFLQSLINVTVLPDMSRLRNLRRVHLESMRGLQNIDGLAKAPVLEEFVHLCALNMDPEQYESLIRMPSLRKGLFGVSSEKKSEQIEALMKKHGVEQYKHQNFKFR
jgi:hypothetical protein